MELVFVWVLIVTIWVKVLVCGLLQCSSSNLWRDACSVRVKDTLELVNVRKTEIIIVLRRIIFKIVIDWFGCGDLRFWNLLAEDLEETYVGVLMVDLAVYGCVTTCGACCSWLILSEDGPRGAAAVCLDFSR
ncbi:hypothetical protein Droror1_Dr00011819 [Drosera rotundifolia]